MAVSLVQSAKGTSSLATTTIAFASAPASGNLIVLAFAADDYNGTPNAGWTESTGMAREGGSFHGGYVWWRVSNGSNSFQYTIGSATKSAWVLMEFSGVEASPYDTSAGQNVNSSDNSYSTPNLTPTAGDRLLIAAVGCSLSGSAMADPGHSWSNSFTGIDRIGSPSAPADAIGTAYRTVTANGSTAYSTAATLSYNVESRSGMIIAFKAASAGGAVNGSLSQPVGAITQSGSGKLLLKGSASQTLGALTQTATGKVIKSGNLAQTIGPVTQSANGRLTVSGSLSGTIGDFSLSAAGGVAASGSVNAKIDPITQAASGAVLIQGGFGQTIGPVAQAASGALTIKGVFGKTIEPVTLVAAGSSADLPEIDGRINQSIGLITLNAAGEGPSIGQPFQPGGFIPRPIIYVDKHGNPVDLETYQVRKTNQAIQAAKVEVKTIPRAGRIEAAQTLKALQDAIKQEQADLIAARSRELASMLDTTAQILFELEQIVIQRQQEDDDLLAILLLAA